MNVKKYEKQIITVIYALAGTISLPGILAYQGENLWYTNSFFAFFFFALNLYIGNRIIRTDQETTKRNKAFAVLFAFCFSLALHFGAALESDTYVTFTNLWMWISILLFTLYISVPIHRLWECLSNWKACIKTKEQENDQKTKPSKITHFLQGILDTPYKTWMALLLLWLPTFLAFFPGAFVYDAQDEYVQVASRTFTTHHPLLHELLLGVPIRAAEHFGLHANWGIAFYTIFQMTAMSGILTCVLFLLKKWNVKRGYRGMVFVLYALFPIYPMYAVCSAKDTLFTGCFFLIVVILIDQIKDVEPCKNRLRTIIFIMVSVCMMLLRNNGVYAYIVLIPILLLLGWKQWKKIAPVMIVSVILFVLVSTGLKLMLHATDEEHQEVLTVPIQQMARTYQFAPEVFTATDQNTLFEILSPQALDTYTPKISDIIKSQFDNKAYEKNKGKYVSLWLRTGLKKPFVYLNAWFLTSYGYWYPDAILNSYGGTMRFTFQYEDSSYFGFETEPPGERHSLFPLLEEWYRNISLELFQQRVPAISMLFSPGFLFWVFAFYWMYFLRNKKLEVFSILSGIVLLWLTVILGPTTLVRYVLILWMILPLLPAVDSSEG